MRMLSVTLAALFVFGCQSAPQDYRTLTERLSAGDDVAPAALREAFLASIDLPERMERLSDLEQQALAIVEDEPLKLGSMGSAMLDTYYGSLTGHFVLDRFYRHVSAPEAAARHEAWLQRIADDMQRHGDGSAERPLPAVTPAEARTYVVSRGGDVVGSIYQSSESVPFSLLLQVRRDGAPIEGMHFDLSGLYHSVRQAFIGLDEDGGPGELPGDHDFSPFTLIGFLAKQNDSAAQSAIGAFLARDGRTDEAARWLRAASRSGNLLANLLLARIHWEQARGAGDDTTREFALDQVMENYLHAIALGSSDAMYALAVLYLNGHYGEQNKVSGVPLLEQADAADHSDATLFLAHLHYTGEVVDKDLDAARGYYARAAELGNPFARRSYARFLLDRDAAQPGDPRAVTWLTDQARDGEAESMLLLGNLHARGIGTPHSVRRAVRWFKQAVTTAPNDASIVNEVAWTLTVSDQDALRRVRYARTIMDQLMASNEGARQRPEYLDTWAATYAATGDFDRAVALQEQAVDVAMAAEYEDVLEILQKHLAEFQAGRTLSEAVP
jgi:TPR repeat protein